MPEKDMADQAITKQELIDAQKDAQTLEDVVNGEPGKLIKSRTGRKFYSLASVPQINNEQQQINNDVYNSINIFTKRNNGFISLFEYIPPQFHNDIKNLATSLSEVGDVSDYIQDALDYAEDNLLDVIAPFAYYCVSKAIKVPPKIRFVGLGHPFFITLSGFVGDSILNTDNTEQPEYYIDNFYLNGGGTSTPTLAGLHVGGCRNSTFKNIAVTSCPEAAVLVYPTHIDSGDVENIELDHIWSILGAGITFKTNSGIARGNITDGTVTNCQLTSGDATTVNGYPITIVSSAGKQIFGLKFDRIFTKATDNNHFVIVPNGGDIYANSFRNFTGESWTISKGGLSPKVDKECLFVLDGKFFNNTFDNFYSTGMQGQGISLGNGSIDNTFNGLVFNDFSFIGFNNRWVNFANGAKNNKFLDVSVRTGIKFNDGTGAAAANLLFNQFSGKVRGATQDNYFDGDITSRPISLVKRSSIFALNGSQLANYPVAGVTFASDADGVKATIPAGSTPYFLTIPFTRPITTKSTIVHVYISLVVGVVNGLQMSLDIGGSGVSIDPLVANEDRYCAFMAELNPANKTITVVFSGTRTNSVDVVFKDISVGLGGIPYAPNFVKQYAES